MAANGTNFVRLIAIYFSKQSIAFSGFPMIWRDLVLSVLLLQIEAGSKFETFIG